jgi:hypothetical protein
MARGCWNSDDAQAWAADIQSFQTRRARDQKIERVDAPARGDDNTSFSDIAADPANALPWRCFGQDLKHGAGLIDEIRIDHTIAILRHGVASLDPDRRSCQGQWRIGRRADEIAGAQGPAIARCDIGRRKRI